MCRYENKKKACLQNKFLFIKQMIRTYFEGWFKINDINKECTLRSAKKIRLKFPRRANDNVLM